MKHQRQTASCITVTVVALALAVVGCGQFVDPLDYNPNAPPGDGEIVVRTDVKSIKHSALSSVVEAFSAKSPDGEFVVIDYDALADDIDMRFVLEGYLRLLATVDPSGLESKSEKLAYWINGYNASVIKSVLDSYDGDHGFKTVEASGFFTTPRHVFAGVMLSLNQAEHGAGRNDFDARAADFVGLTPEALEKLRGWATDLWGFEMPYSRLHAAFNCGALSCPNLPSAAPFVFDPQKIQAQLDQYTTAWVDNVKKGAGPDGVSQLFSWYQSDFERTHGSVKGFLDAFRSDGSAGVALDKSLDYDWTLNSTNNLPGALPQQ